MGDLEMEHSSSSTTNDTNSADSMQVSELEFTEDEETLIIRMFNLLGERWSLIAGRIPGRTAEEIEKYWNSRYSTSEEQQRRLRNIGTPDTQQVKKSRGD